MRRLNPGEMRGHYRGAQNAQSNQYANRNGDKHRDGDTNLCSYCSNLYGCCCSSITADFN